MEQTEGKDLFEIKLNDPGKMYIRKFAVLARVMILVGLFISLIHITSTVLRYTSFDPELYANYKYYLLEHKFLPYYTVIYCLLFYPQMYTYWQVTKCLRKGLNYNDEAVFNKAFQALFRYSVFGVILMALSVLSYGFELFVFIKYYTN
ncbi:MAG TPA: hypothetical protein VIZ28_19830 [Chitinophagaceae bacterium]